VDRKAAACLACAEAMPGQAAAGGMQALGRCGQLFWGPQLPHALPSAMQLLGLHVSQLFIPVLPIFSLWQEQLVPGLSSLGIQTGSLHMDDKP